MMARRGDLFWIDWEPARGVEQKGHRPGLVVQNDVGNRSSKATVVVAISTSAPVRPFPFVVSLSSGEGGLKRASHVNCSQLLTVDQSRLLEKIGSLGAERMRDVDRALAYELGLR